MQDSNGRNGADCKKRVANPNVLLITLPVWWLTRDKINNWLKWFSYQLIYNSTIKKVESENSSPSHKQSKSILMSLLLRYKHASYRFTQAPISDLLWPMSSWASITCAADSSVLEQTLYEKMDSKKIIKKEREGDEGQVGGKHSNPHSRHIGSHNSLSRLVQRVGNLQTN